MALFYSVFTIHFETLRVLMWSAWNKVFWEFLFPGASILAMESEFGSLNKNGVYYLTCSTQTLTTLNVYIPAQKIRCYIFMAFHPFHYRHNIRNATLTTNFPPLNRHSKTFWYLINFVKRAILLRWLHFSSSHP